MVASRINTCSSFMFYETDGKLLLTDPPEITDRPRQQSVRVNGVATFFCGAKGDPPPVIQWKKNGKKVPGTRLYIFIPN